MPKTKQHDYRTYPAGRPEGYVTVRRAMEIAQCSEPTMRRWIQKRRVSVIRWRDRTLICEKDLRNWSRVRRYRPRKVWRPQRGSPVSPTNPGAPTGSFEEAQDAADSAAQPVPAESAGQSEAM